MRGGFLHSGAAFQPLLWAMGSCGFQEVIVWGEKNRKWQQKKAGNIFGATLVILLMGITGFVFSERVIGKDLRNPTWNESFLTAQQINLEAEELGLANNLIMINNPPGYYAAVGKSAIVIPNGNVDVLLEAARRFGANAVILEENHPKNLDNLYLAPTSERRLAFLGSKNGIHYFLIP